MGSVTNSERVIQKPKSNNKISYSSSNGESDLLKNFETPSDYYKLKMSENSV